jgi:general secretion pathway protein K
MGSNAPARSLSPWSSRSERRNAGFALLIVLWTLVLIAFLVLHLTTSGHNEIRIANNLDANAVASAAADGGIATAIYNLSSPRPDERWPVDGPAQLLTVGDCRVAVELENEAALVNPSLASPALMEALLRAVGSDPDNAHRIAEAIGDWVGNSPKPKNPDVLKAEYQSAGLDYAPPGAPFETIDELARVLGMTPELYAALRPHLTLYGPAEPELTTTDPVVAAALAQIPQLAQAATPGAATQQDSMTVRIIANAAGLGNARASRTAIVRIGSSAPQGYEVLAWRDSLN